MSSKKIAVIGAGIIGLSTAYYLQKAGCQVFLIDKQEPGTGTSRGHASMIANYGVPGINNLKFGANYQDIFSLIPHPWLFSGVK